MARAERCLRSGMPQQVPASTNSLSKTAWQGPCQRQRDSSVSTGQRKNQRKIKRCLSLVAAVVFHTGSFISQQKSGSFQRRGTWLPSILALQMQETQSISITNPLSSSQHYFLTLSKRVNIKSLPGFRHYPDKEKEEKEKIPCITSLSSPQTFSDIFVLPDLAFMQRCCPALSKSSRDPLLLPGELMDPQNPLCFFLMVNAMVNARSCLKTS